MELNSKCDFDVRHNSPYATVLFEGDDVGECNALGNYQMAQLIMLRLV